MDQDNFQKSDVGAQAAWKGFSSQTLYIASRLISDEQGYEYYPEDIEDLIIKKDGIVVEAVQIKNISVALTLSSLALTKTSKGGEGFFRRMCSLHAQNPNFNNIKVVYFGYLGTELQEVKDNNDNTKKSLSKRLEDKHNLSIQDATWLINALNFEKVDIDELKRNIYIQVSSYVPVMSAPDLAQELLIQHVSELSNTKGFTTLKMWQEKIHKIGVSVAAIDGFYKEYNKSLVCLSDFQMSSSPERLQDEFLQGVSVHPDHIRSNLDFKRNYWLNKIHETIKNTGVALVKGVSGQGKSTLCYRYLMDAYPEGVVFCVRTIATEGQAQNLVSALVGLGKHNKELIIYIDVQPGETLWAFLLQELQFRGLEIPVLISIRDEDYNVTPINGKSIKYTIIELVLSETEAEQIYNKFTAVQPHSSHRTFEEAWQSFGGNGSMIEFVYFLTHNQTLTKRLQNQIDCLLQEGIKDECLVLLQLVCYAGRLGCSVYFREIQKIVTFTSMYAAINRLKDEYLVRIVDGNKLEAFHPVRAQIIFDILCNQIYMDATDIVFKALPCVSSQNVRLILLDYFSENKYVSSDVQQLSQICFSDWVGYANAIKAMLWLDAKRYADNNMNFIRNLVEKQGKAWFCFLPRDLSGIEYQDELIADSIKDISIINKVELQKIIDETKYSLTSLSIDYQATDYFIKNCRYPVFLPNTDDERTLFGYALFWMAKRNFKVTLPFDSTEIVASVCTGEVQACADAICGLSEHSALSDSYQSAAEVMVRRLISEMSIVSFAVTDDEVSCKFIPPILTEEAIPENVENSNQFWRIKMLDILQQIYPKKEFINIELIGVDLLKDLGINAMDHILHIPKCNRPNSWVSEVNGWTRNRIDYSFRPASWKQYVSEIDEMRSNVNELVLETIKLIDDIYKRGHYTKDRWKRVENRIKTFKNHIFAENRLPFLAVDPYCLYSEGNTKRLTFDYLPTRQLLSVEKYEKFRKLLNNVYSSIENFYNQFAEVLMVRIKKQDISIVNNPRLAMFNLFSAAKTIVSFQQEYISLFSRYSSLKGSFAQQELENILTLVNVWRHVLDNQPKGYAIAYDAKQKYRKGSNYFEDTLAKALREIKGTLVKTEHYAYIIVDCNVLQGENVESEYLNTVLQIRNVFRGALMLSSDRWYVETQSLKLAYIPSISGIYFPVAFLIPFYKVFDVDESQIMDTMFPCEIEQGLEGRILSGGMHFSWIEAMQKISIIKLYLQCYEQVTQVPVDEECNNSVITFRTSLVENIELFRKELVPCELLVKELVEEADGQNKQFLEMVKLFFDFFDDIKSCIENNDDPSEIMQVIDSVFGLMISLLPYVIKHSLECE
ncbi:MAG: hypothetical protein K2L07_09050 [Lachnospiraceae bacterium]|nr:hypothetical protein [Lachnospiraceae bacterium]